MSTHLALVFAIFYFKLTAKLSFSCSFGWYFLGELLFAIILAIIKALIQKCFVCITFVTKVPSSLIWLIVIPLVFDILHPLGPW